MEAIRRQAAKLREQVARQQQAIMRQLGSFGGEGGGVVDEEEMQCRQRLKDLFTSTRAAKHFQKSIVRGIESIVSVCSKEMEIVRKLADDCCRYGNENKSAEYPLATTALSFGVMHSSAEQEKEVLLDVLVEEELHWKMLGFWFVIMTNCARKWKLKQLKCRDASQRQRIPMLQ